MYREYEIINAKKKVMTAIRYSVSVWSDLGGRNGLGLVAIDNPHLLIRDKGEDTKKIHHKFRDS